MVKKKNTKTQKAWHGLWQDTRQRNRDTWPQKKTLQEKIDFANKVGKIKQVTKEVGKCDCDGDIYGTMECSAGATEATGAWCSKVTDNQYRCEA